VLQRRQAGRTLPTGIPFPLQIRPRHTDSRVLRICPKVALILASAPRSQTTKQVAELALPRKLDHAVPRHPLVHRLWSPYRLRSVYAIDLCDHALATRRHGGYGHVHVFVVTAEVERRDFRSAVAQLAQLEQMIPRHAHSGTVSLARLADRLTPSHVYTGHTEQRNCRNCVVAPENTIFTTESSFKVKALKAAGGGCGRKRDGTEAIHLRRCREKRSVVPPVTHLGCRGRMNAALWETRLLLDRQGLYKI